MDNHDVTPDKCLLTHIFAEHQPARISTILQNWDKCVFKAEFSDGGRPSCVARLEANDGERKSAARFAAVATMQQIASTRIPDLIPKIIQTGTAANTQGRAFEFCVMEFVEGHTLEAVWDRMDDADQVSVVVAVVKAMEKLQSVRLSDPAVQAMLRPALRLNREDNEEAVLEAVTGGPPAGFLKDGPALLTSIMQRLKLNKPFYHTKRITDPDGGLAIQSNFEDLDSTTVRDSDMDQWPKEAVLCHNDLTPRNLIVRLSQSLDGKTRYKLAAIVDWELAGFYPPSYQLGLQDTYLSSANRHIRFYLLLKQQMKDLVPRSRSQIALLEAAELIFESRQRKLAEGMNIPALIRQRFRETMHLYRDKDPYTGWIYIYDTREGPPLPISSYIDAQKLEDDIVAEVTVRR